MYLYWTKRIKEGGAPGTEELVRRALAHFAPERLPGEMARTVHGRPYFPELEDLFFSVSHSGRLWACAVDRVPLGFDLEDRGDSEGKGRKCLTRSAAIAGRFFTPEEADYVADQGEEGFFRIWVRKEAALKYAGVGLSLGMDGFRVLKDGQFLERIVLAKNRGGDWGGDRDEDPTRGSDGQRTAMLEGLWMKELEPGILPLPQVVAAYCGPKPGRLEGVTEL